LRCKRDWCSLFKHINKSRKKGAGLFFFAKHLNKTVPFFAYPSWSTVRSRFWKNEAVAPEAANTYGSENLARMSKGLAPHLLKLVSVLCFR
jgi:hypothetical protein